MEIITTKRGRVIGIGEIKVFPSDNMPYEIPLLSFIVIKEKEIDERFPVFTYVSTCIQLQMDGYGETPEEAKVNMCKRCAEYLEILFTDERCKQYAWKNLQDLFHLDEYFIEEQNAYNAMRLNFAEKGIATDLTNALIDEIAELKKRIAELEALKDKVEIGRNEIGVKVIQYEEAA